MKSTINFLLAGVGGQGTVLASAVLVNVGLAAGFSAKQAEIHGMSQRGGSVVSMVRWGDVVYSPLIGLGEADVLLAFEKAEALRCVRYLRPGALALVNAVEILPLTVTSGGQVYPDDQHLRTVIGQVTDHATYLDASAIARGVGNERAANVVLLGALSGMLQGGRLERFSAPVQAWLDAVSAEVPPRHVELNRRAFVAGREAVAAATTA